MEKKLKLVISELVVLCALVFGHILSEFFGTWVFVVYCVACLALYFFILLMLKKEVKEDFWRYGIYFLLLLLLVLYALFAILKIKENVFDLRPLLLAILGLFCVNLVFRSIFAKKYVEGRVLLCDGELATVELPFDLFAAINPGKYVVKCDKNFKKGDKVKVLIKSGFFKRVPDRII
ncbi:MAG: DUF2101 family protein [Candidatus Diapherotrites archaeon]